MVQMSDADLQAHLAERLAPYKLPKSFERVVTGARIAFEARTHTQVCLGIASF